MKKKAVIFDMDGLMFDTQWIYDKAYDDIALAEYDFIVPHQMHIDMMGASGEDIIRAAARYLPAHADARAFIRRCFDLVAERVRTDLKARPGLNLILPYLSDKGYCLALASGSEGNAVFAEYGSTRIINVSTKTVKTCYAYIRNLDIARIFSDVKFESGIGDIARLHCKAFCHIFSRKRCRDLTKFSKGIIRETLPSDTSVYSALFLNAFNIEAYLIIFTSKKLDI